jgi:putative radical SAM enzyme (TIGR03279 family)
MSVVISGVKSDSLAERLGIQPGDVLVSVNGHKIMDVLDYKFYMTDTQLNIEIMRGNNKNTVKLLKQPYDDIGLEFETYLMDKQHSCKNKCIFCFIDQLPKGMRKTLYFKDDDSRLSFLFGNYITLTNITEHEVERIISMHISPINISVHTTNPELRCAMMNNRFAGEQLSILRRFADAGIKMNCQIVLCPGINDGVELDRTLSDLSELVPAVQSVAGVPVGLTKYREGLHILRTYTKREAAEVIRQMEIMGEKMLKQHGIRVFYPADEFYLKAELPLRDEEFYDDFAQLENGVGMMTLFKTQFKEELEFCEEQPKGSCITIATGTAAKPFISDLVKMAYNKWDNLNIEVVPIVNRFLGETINVAGLITGRDLIEQLKPQVNGGILLIPSVMLRREGDLFLDDISLDDVATALNVQVMPVPVVGSDFLNALLV